MHFCGSSASTSEHHKGNQVEGNALADPSEPAQSQQQSPQRYL